MRRNLDKVASDKVASDKVASDKVASDKVALDKVALYKVASNKVAYLRKIGKFLHIKTGIKTERRKEIVKKNEKEL